MLNRSGAGKKPRKPRTVLTAGVALLLFCALSSSAQAATGEFEYTRADGMGHITFLNPDDACRTMSGGGAKDISNRTDTVASIYKFDDCRSEGFIATVGARGGTWPPNPTLTVAHAVKFG
ncbi:hypothetical protein ABZ953_38680 [Streptomyces sp. NPDC046465]|uniref:hypothetical protein n=1 Tax=Streptomyces sp. NPDC046465 TaxID=3155810 RepID=UPI0033E3AF7C